jgi:hypothetical protein
MKSFIVKSSSFLWPLHFAHRFATPTGQCTHVKLKPMQVITLHQLPYLLPSASALPHLLFDWLLHGRLHGGGHMLEFDKMMERVDMSNITRIMTRLLLNPIPRGILNPPPYGKSTLECLSPIPRTFYPWPFLPTLCSYQRPWQGQGLPKQYQVSQLLWLVWRSCYEVVEEQEDGKGMLRWSWCWGWWGCRQSLGCIRSLTHWLKSFCLMPIVMLSYAHRYCSWRKYSREKH